MDSKILSLRANKAVSFLFHELQAISKNNINKTENRTELVNRALEEAISDKSIDWKDISKLKFENYTINNFNSSNQPTFLQIRVDVASYRKITDDIKRDLNISRVTIPYFMKLLLSYYLKKLSSESYDTCAINSVDKMVSLGIDFFVFKREYDLSNHIKKEELYVLSRKYLEANVNLNNKLREDVNSKIKGLSDYFNIYKYVPKPNSNFAKCNIVYISKVLAGLFLTLSEIENYDIEDTIRALKKEVDCSDK